MRLAWIVLGAALACASCEMFQPMAPEEVDAYARAQSLAAAGDYSGAAARLTEFVSQRPTDRYVSDAWLLLGDCRAKLGDWPGALSAYEQAQVKPRTTAIAARAQAGAGQAFMADGRRKEAIRAWESALRTSEADLDAPVVLLPLGKAYLLDSNWVMGRDRLNKLATKYPGSPQALEARDILAQPSGIFCVDFGSFATRDEATGFVDGIAKKDVRNARIVERPGMKAPFAVRAGMFVNREAAQQEADRLKEMVPEATVFP